MVLRVLGLAAAAAAIDCGRYGLMDFDRTHIATSLHSTPPSRTNKTVYFNPCSPVKGPKECAADDHFCALEWTEVGRKWQLTHAIPVGSPAANATEHEFYDSDAGRYDGGEESSERGLLELSYDGALWGDETQTGVVTMWCGPEEKIELNPAEPDWRWGGAPTDWHVVVFTPALCKNGAPGQAPPPPGAPPRGGWGFFTWLFVLLLLGLVAYAALTVYVNYANAHGSLPTDLGDVLRDLPYLFRDLVRRISESLSSRRSGYSAI